MKCIDCYFWQLLLKGCCCLREQPLQESRWSMTRMQLGTWTPRSHFRTIGPWVPNNYSEYSGPKFWHRRQETSILVNKHHSNTGQMGLAFCSAPFWPGMNFATSPLAGKFHRDPWDSRSNGRVIWMLLKYEGCICTSRNDCIWAFVMVFKFPTITKIFNDDRTKYDEYCLHVWRTYWCAWRMNLPVVTIFHAQLR